MKVFEPVLHKQWRLAGACRLFACWCALAGTQMMHTIYIENQAGQKVRIHIISQEGFELTKDWNDREPFLYALEPLFISVYEYNQPYTCSKFYSRGSSSFDTIRFEKGSGGIVGYYKLNQQIKGPVTRKACINMAWEPNPWGTGLVTIKQERETKPSAMSQNQRGRQVQPADMRHETGRGHPHEQNNKKNAPQEEREGLRILNQTQQPLKLRIYTSGGEELFCDVGSNGSYVLRPDQSPINMTVYPKTGTIQPCISFPRIGTDASLNTLVITGADMNMLITYGRMTPEGRMEPYTTTIKPDPNATRIQGWNASRELIYSSTVVPANNPPSQFVPVQSK